MSSRFMWVMVCDDVRQEMGNKPSYMGVYTTGIFVPSFPATLSRLFAVMHVRTAGDEPFHKLTLRVLKDDTEIVTMEVPQDQIAAMHEHAKAQRPDIANGESTFYDAGFVVQFVPLVLEQTCVLRFRAETERETLKGGSISIRSAAPALSELPA